MSKPNKSKTADEHRDYFVHWERKLMRLCAVGMVSDGTLNEREKEAIVEIIKRDIKSSKQPYPQKMLETLKRAKNGNSTVEKQLNLLKEGDREVVTSLLASINKARDSGFYALLEKEDPKKLLENPDFNELVKDYVDYILFLLINPEDKNKDAQKGLFVDAESEYLSDRDALRELRDMVYVIKADNVVAEVERMAFVSIAKVYKFSGVDRMWNKFFDKDKDFLLDDDKEKEKEETISRDMYVLRRTPISVHDVKVIETAITKSGMLGPLRYGLQSAIQRDKYDLIKHRERRRRDLSRIASIVFAISSLLVFFECAFHLELKLHNELVDLYDVIKPDGGKICFAVIALISVLSFCFICYKWIIKTQYSEKLIWRGLDKHYIKYPLKLIGISLLFCIPAYYWHIAEHELNLSEFAQKINHICHICWSPLCVLCMMLSIEIMIFMRERYTKDNKNLSKHSTSSALLIIFVIAAVVADLCIGFIEIPYNEYGNFSIIAPKVAYSIFLGCLSFFAGKFMEMDAIQKHAEVIEMDGYIKNIKEHLDKSEN